MDNISHYRAARGMVSSLPLLALLGAAPRPNLRAPSPVNVRLSEWKLELSQPTITSGPVRFIISNVGNIPHGFEIEGQGIEKEIVTLKPGTYEAYCPVGEDSHKKLGMEAQLKVVQGEPSGSNASRMSDSNAGT